MRAGEGTLRLLLAPIASPLGDADVTELVVNRPGELGVERRGAGWSWHDVSELTFARLDAIATLCASLSQQDVGPEHPLCGASLPDGQRVQICRPPAVTAGTISLTIRRPSGAAPTIAALAAGGLFDRTERAGQRLHPADNELLALHRARNWEAFFPLAVRSRKTIVATGDTGSGKAQPLDAKVLTPTGFRRMGDLRVGDPIVTPDGKVAPVTGVFPQGEVDIYRVTFLDGRQVECCGDHLWKVWHRISRNRREQAERRPGVGWHIAPLSKIQRWLATDCSDMAQRVAVPLVSPFAIEQASVNLPIPPYALGALLGDGSFRPGSSVKFTTADLAILERMLAELPEYEAVGTGANRGLDYRLRVRVGSSPGLRICQGQARWSPLRWSLSTLGLDGLGSHAKFVPDIYKHGSVAQRLALLQGLLDTDGSVGVSHASATFSSTSERLARDVQELAWSLGAIAKLARRQTTCTAPGGARKVGRLSWRVNIVHPDVGAFFSLPRKRERVRTKPTDIRLRIARVEPAGRKLAQCIAVDHPEHLYVTDGYVVTHNTTFAKALTQAIPLDERLVTIEDTAEFTGLPQRNLVSLFYSKGRQGIARIGSEDLMEAALRMRPDRVLMQELRDGAAFTFVRSVAAGHPGSITTCHAGSAAGAFDALRLMVKQHEAGRHLADADVRVLLLGLVDVVVHCRRTGGRFGIDEVWFDPAAKAGRASAMAAE